MNSSHSRRGKIKREMWGGEFEKETHTQRQREAERGGGSKTPLNEVIGERSQCRVPSAQEPPAPAGPPPLPLALSILWSAESIKTLASGPIAGCCFLRRASTETTRN